MLRRRTVRAMAATALCCVAMSAHAAPKRKSAVPQKHVDQAYFDGHLVNFHAAGVKNSHSLVVGPWDLGPRVSPGPSDRRPNLYFVSPGTQNRTDGRPEYDHNVVLSAIPDGESGFDVFWVIVLDPSVTGDFTSEQQIIMATQETFTPPPDFTFMQLPSAGFLSEYLKIGDLDGLDKFRRPDGALPKVAIVPGKFTVRAVAEDTPESHDDAAEPPADHSK